ncbi:MAG: TonB-dependent receptor, partial [Cellvibrionaceae bacterium]|nr:TonB-dependent receptor [Cellvibrionaceae bacterium]
KFQYSEELSDETYLGLSDADFNADPDRRYGLSQFDEMNTYHAGAYIRHRIELRPELSLNTTIYRNQFKRDWYKVKGVGGLIDDVNQGNDNAANAQAILNGQADLDKAAVKYNNRDYTSEGIQMTLDWELGQHQLEMGARYHEDDVSRYQPEDIYQQINGQLQFDYQKAPSSSNNRYEKAEALALHLMDRWQLNDKLTLNLGLRYEDIDTAQTRYANAERSEVASRRSNQISELLYSAGATYAINDNWQLLGGVHEGFSPTSPSARENIDPETSTNYDLGLRYFGERLNASVIGFYSDFASSVTNCSVARPCGDQTSGARSQGEAEVQGLEVTASAQLYQGDNLSIPLQLSYTYTDAEITNPKDGDNLAGDVYAYVPENQFYTQLGVELDNGIAGYLSASYVDEMCTDNLACGRNGVDQRFIYTDDYWVVDVSGHWQVNPSTKLYLKVDNLLDKRAIVSRHPDGARPNKPRSASIGVSFNF